MNVKIVFDNIRSVYNVGSIFRTMEGFGFADAILVGITPTPISPKGEKRKDFVKTALGAEDRVNWSYRENMHEVLDEYNDYYKIALEKTDGGIEIGEAFTDIAEEKNILFILGSEVDGISTEILDRCDKIVHIHMHGYKESFNVSVAAGIALYVLKNMEK